MQEFERRVRRLEEGLDRVSARTERIGLARRSGGGAGGAISIETVDTFPPIPEEGTRIVHFSGDGGLWKASVGDAHWFPMSDWTDYEGTPGEEA